MPSMNIGILGLGVVGSAVQNGLLHIGQAVRGYDPKQPDTKFEDVLDTEVCFICVPTPTDAEGRCNTSIVEEVLTRLADAKYKGVATIKSTVPPGTTEAFAKKFSSLRVAFCPEFLRERVALGDFLERHDLCAIGAYKDEDYEAIKSAHGSIPQQFVRLSPTEAELLKYFSNVYNALRIVFANEFYEVSKAVGADYSKIKAAVVMRPGIPDQYLEVNDNMRGFAGVCLPKDTRALATFVKDIGLGHLKLFETIVEENAKFKATVPTGMRLN